jgi:hypothetical protein
LSPQPPADAPTRRPEPVDDPTTTGATALTSDAPATGDEAAAAGEASDNAAQGDRDGQSWRALFRDNGSWTAVSQVALVIVSVLGVIQVTVLLTIDGHLRDAAGEDADVISPLLVAQDKVGDVMLPGLLGISTVALGFAISRSVAERRAASSDGEQTFVPAMARLPIALWTVTIPLGALLTLVVTWTAPETLEMARFLNRQSLVIVGLLAVTSVLGAAALRPYTAAADGASHDGGRDADDTVAPATG